MAVRYVVEDTLEMPGRGPAVLGLLLDGVITTGDTLLVQETGASVRISFVDFHTRETDRGLLVGLQVDPADAPLVTAGSTLVSPPGA